MDLLLVAAPAGGEEPDQRDEEERYQNSYPGDAEFHAAARLLFELAVGDVFQRNIRIVSLRNCHESYLIVRNSLPSDGN